MTEVPGPECVHLACTNKATPYSYQRIWVELYRVKWLLPVMNGDPGPHEFTFLSVRLPVPQL